jgi:methionyl-tRNA formyltransferase
MRILFWGTPDFAVPPLRALLGEGSDVVGVVTQPDRPRGRSRSRLDPSPVKQVAAAEGIPVLQPERPRGDAFMDEVRALAPDLSVGGGLRAHPAARGHRPARAGTLNIHASVLPLAARRRPDPRGHPAGVRDTGVTIMRMVPALDAGPVCTRWRRPCTPTRRTASCGAA